jgi:hypothetical protein
MRESKYMYCCSQILQQKRQVHIRLLPDPPAENGHKYTIASRSSNRESRYMYYCFQILQQRKQVLVPLLPILQEKTRYMHDCTKTAVVAFLHAVLDVTI